MNSIFIPWKNNIRKNDLDRISSGLSDFASKFQLKFHLNGVSIEAGQSFDQISLIRKTLEAAGLSMELEAKEFKVEGMSCANCAVSVDSIVRGQEGIVASTLNYANAQLWVYFIPSLAKFGAIKLLLQKAEYDIQESDATNSFEAEDAKAALILNKLKWRAILALVLCIPIILLGMFFMDWSFTPYLLWGLSSPIIFGLGNSYFIKAWNLLRLKRVSMDTLVSVSSIVAYVTSVLNICIPGQATMDMTSRPIYFESAAVVIAFLLLGKWLEEKTKAKTGAAIRNLMSLHPDRVMREINSGALEDRQSGS